MVTQQIETDCIPRCIKGFHVDRIFDFSSELPALQHIKRDSTDRVYSIACSCGGSHGDIYSVFRWGDRIIFPPVVTKTFWQDLIAAFSLWPSKPEKPRKVRAQIAEGRVIFQCKSCGKSTSVIDPAIHGWDGEQGSTCGYDADEKLVIFEPPEGKQLRFIAFFAYSKNNRDVIVPGVEPCDLFSDFSLVGVPEDGKELIEIAEFELA